jgi:hypothetical protein
MDERGRLKLPTWYLLRFELNYPDGRLYAGECSWPPWYDDLLRHDIRMATGAVRPGKTLTSVRKVWGERVFAFVPDGRGTMTLPDGTRQAGRWREGRFLGPEPQPAPSGTP